VGAGTVKATLRFVLAAALVGLAAGVLLLAADVRAWHRVLAEDDVGAPGRQIAAHVPGGLAERLLAVGDDVRARRAVQLFRQNVSLRQRLDNAVEVTSSRAGAELALAAVARGTGPRASQAGTLLGILAFGDLARGGGRDQSQADAAAGDFAGAVRANPDDAAAKFDLELLLRSLAARGVRTGPAPQSGAGPQGRNGASNGTPGSGY
jgi:hypothetical protein